MTRNSVKTPLKDLIVGGLLGALTGLWLVEKYQHTVEEVRAEAFRSALEDRMRRDVKQRAKRDVEYLQAAAKALLTEN